MKAYRELHEHFKKIGELNHVQAIIGWDEATMMPAGGGDARANAMATLNVVVHDLETSSILADLIAAAGQEELDDWQMANLRLIARKYRIACALPADLVAASTRARAACAQAWRYMRADNNWVGLQPLLEENLALARKEAQLIGDVTGHAPYDALIDRYEPGMGSERIQRLFSELKLFLPDFVGEVLERQQQSVTLSPGNHFPIDQQRDLGLRLMGVLGFDFNHGRLDVSHHPFCGGVPDDVRITTRYREDSFIETIMAVLHETGHALYEQGLPADWRGQPVGEALGMGMHESQSLIMEMQACRSREFMGFLAPLARQAFGAAEGPAWETDNFHRLYSRVKPGLIRVDADEVTYPLHIILRFELESALILGDMEMRHVPDAWDAAMQELLGLSTGGNYKDGCLQDVHWMEGLFGYFPTYTLGALTAAQLFATARESVPGLLESIGEGDFTPLRSWLRAHIHTRGSLLGVDELLMKSTGSVLDTRFFREHLERRYR